MRKFHGQFSRKPASLSPQMVEVQLPFVLVICSSNSKETIQRFVNNFQEEQLLTVSFGGNQLTMSEPLIMESSSHIKRFVAKLSRFGFYRSLQNLALSAHPQHIPNGYPSTKKWRHSLSKSASNSEFSFHAKRPVARIAELMF